MKRCVEQPSTGHGNSLTTMSSTHMHFGAFIWAASSRQSFDFNGNVSYFEIHKCFGADITYNSTTNQTGQVPYEGGIITRHRCPDK